MNKNNAKALSTLRQKIRKYNRDFETEIATYKEVSYSYDNNNRFKSKVHALVKIILRKTAGQEIIFFNVANLALNA